MKIAWSKAKPELFDQMKKGVQAVYSNLHFYIEDDVVFVRGSFPVMADGRAVDRYSIEIECHRFDPEEIPILREIGGRIPRTADNHINGPPGDVCLFVPDERWKIYPIGSTLLDFLNGPVRNYFLGYSLVEMGEPWPFGERSHGKAGILEFYSELLETNDYSTIVRYVECLSKTKIKGHWDCPCGSRKRIRNCHFANLRDLREKIPPSVAKRSLSQLRGSL